MEIILDQGPRRKPFRPHGSNMSSRPQGHRPVHQRPPGIRPPGSQRHAAQNARNNYERYPLDCPAARLLPTDAMIGEGRVRLANVAAKSYEEVRPRP